MDPPHPHAPDPERSAGLLVVAGPVARAADVHALCDRLSTLMARCAADTVLCDVHGLRPDVRALEALARLQLTARRARRRIRLQRAAPELLQLLDLAGLAEAIPPATAPQRALGLQLQRKPEQREDPRDVEEAVDRRDAAV